MADIFNMASWIDVSEMDGPDLLQHSRRDPVLDSLIAQEEDEWQLPLAHYSSVTSIDWDRLSDFKHQHLKTYIDL